MVVRREGEWRWWRGGKGPIQYLLTICEHFYMLLASY